MRQKNKRGVSELVSYVLLVVIAVALSVVVYNYLKPMIKTDNRPVCDDDIALVIQDAWCRVGTPSVVNVTMINKGLFKVDAVYIRFANETYQKVPDLINGGGDGRDIYFRRIGLGAQGLMPGEEASKQLSLASTRYPNPSPSIKYVIQIEPAVFKKNILTLCPKSIVTQQIVCS